MIVNKFQIEKTNKIEIKTYTKNKNKKKQKTNPNLISCAFLYTHLFTYAKCNKKKYDNYKGGNQPWSRNNGPSQDNHKPHFL